MRNAHKLLIGKPEGKRLLGRIRRRRRIILKWILRKLSGNVGEVSGSH
jgi:hypothetical protein